MRNYEGKKERRKRKIYSISGINFYLSKGKEKKERGVKKNVWEIAINFWKPRYLKLLQKRFEGFVISRDSLQTVSRPLFECQLI